MGRPLLARLLLVQHYLVCSELQVMEDTLSALYQERLLIQWVLLMLIQVDLQDKTLGTRAMMENMQQAINCWEGGLKHTGGAIVPHKSFVYPIAFAFDNQGKWSYLSKDEIDYNFTVKDLDDTIQNLTTLSPSEGKCTLGVVLAPDGSHTEAVTSLRKKSGHMGSLYQNRSH